MRIDILVDTVRALLASLYLPMVVFSVTATETGGPGRGPQPRTQYSRLAAGAAGTAGRLSIASERLPKFQNS